MDITWHEFEKVLIALQGKIETIEEIQRQKGETFNIFSVLNMERREVETHSALIYDLIYPKGSHSQGNKYLELFVDKVLGFEEFDFRDIDVKREDPTNEGRRIDFTIENEKYFIAIEMKIDAGDQDKQLFDYVTHANKQKKEAKLFYLTLDGKEASEKSTKGEILDYKRLSFALEIVDWIEACIEKSASLPIIRESLIQYANIIRKITGQTTQEVTMQVVDMINNPKIAQAATEMAKNIGYVWALKEAEFWHTLWKKFDGRDTFWINDDHNDMFLNNDSQLLRIEEIANKIAKARASKDADIGFQFFNEDADLRLEIYQFNSEGMRYWLFGNNKAMIDKIGGSIGFRGKKRQGRQSDSKIDLKFYGHGKGDTPTYELFDNNELNTFVESVADEIRGYLNSIDKALEN